MAQEWVDSLYEEHKDAIVALPTSKHEEYNRVRRRAKAPQTISLMFPDTFEVSREEPLWDHHLYVDDAGKFGWNANTWESAVLKTAMESDDFVAWLRNYPRKPWSLAIPYKRRGEDRPLYPDLIIFRRVNDKLLMDLLDPHNPELGDAVEKAVGLADYAKKHGEFFGRIELIRVERDGQVKRLNVNREAIREKVLSVGDPAHLEALFEGQA